MGVSGEGEEMFVKLTAISTASTEEMQQDFQELMKLAVFVVGGLTALCWCAWRRRRDACQTCRDIDGAKALAEEMQQESWHLMKLVVVGLDGSWDCGGVSGEGEEMFVKLTASTTAATAAATPAQERLQQDTRHHMKLMAPMVAGDGRPKALWRWCERRKRKDVCQTYRVFDDSNVTKSQMKTQQDS